VSELGREFRVVHEVLRCGGAERAAGAILDYLRGPSESVPGPP
jgi:hypothetical protein